MNLLKNKKTLPFWLFTFSTIIILIVSQLIQEGIFMDGLFYTCVAKNLADGLGTFWDPHLSKTYMYSFHVQPPLYFGLLALFFKVLGSSMYVERLFCLVFFSGAAIYIHSIWKKIYSHDPTIAAISWLPVLFWVSIPICFWTYTNHLEEVVMSLFALASVYHIFIALHLNQNTIYNLIIAGIFIFLSSLTKGAQGLFPLIGAAAYWLVSKKLSFKKTIIYSLILVAAPTIIYTFLLLVNDDVYNSYHAYFNIRYVRTFSGADSTTGNRFEIIGQLFMELLPIISLSSLLLFFTRKSKQSDESRIQYNVLSWMFLIGLSGSLPLMATLEQRNFYLVTTLPYFAIGIAMFLGPRLASLINKLEMNTNGFRMLTILCATLLIASMIYTSTRVGKAKRDADLISDVYLLGKIIPHGEITGIPVEMMEDWSTRYYLLRYHYISLDINKKNNHFYIIRKNLSKSLVPEGYVPYSLKTKLFDLYVLKNNE
ncbi:MAG: ArnT family glycosyltransferase [Bacteroidota bacterium]